MSQYPDEKGPHSNWLNPGQGSYTSRDGAPPPPQGGYALPPPSSQQYYPPPAQGGYYNAVPSQYPPQPQGYYPAPQGPPPDYGWAQSHPQGDRKGETYVSPPGPPSNNPYAAGPAPPPGPPGAPGPSGAGPAPQDEGNNAMSLGAFFGNKGSPPMWQRQPPPPSAHVPFNAFPDMCLISNTKDLTKGFPEVPPPCQANPHPFATHDVTEEDWKRFLGDVKRAGSLSGAQRIKSNVIPMAVGMGFFSGFMMTNAIERKMKFKNRQAAGDLVDHWNHYFFGPRRMEVVLCQASERLSGKMGAAPAGDPNQQRMASRLRQRGPEDTSDDDSSEEEGYGQHGHGFNQGRGFGRGFEGRGFGGGFGGGGFGDRRAMKRERRAARRERRAERREWKARGDDQEPYQLFITSA